MIIEREKKPDRFFTESQIRRLSELMTRWRAARDAGRKLPLEEQAELEALVDAELEGAAQWAREKRREMESRL